MSVLTNFYPESMTNKDLIERGLIEPPIQISMHQTYCIDFRKLNGLAKFDPESITNKDLMERGLIEPPNSDFNAPVVQVGKKY